MRFFRGFKRGMSDFSHGIAEIVNSTLLSVVYFLGVGITSVIGKIAGKSFLDTRKNTEEKASYWESIDLKKPLKEFYRQF